MARLCLGRDGQCPDRAVIQTGYRCAACTRAVNSASRNPVYDSAWRRLSRRIIRQWIREHGPWCPGYGDRHDPHPSFDLTLDHGDQAGIATSELDISRLRVMCRSWNAVLGRRT